MTSNIFDGVGRVGKGRAAHARGLGRERRPQNKRKDAKEKLSGIASRRFLHLAAIAMLFAFAAISVNAWSFPGHMAVALVAYRQLDPATRTRVDALIAMNPKFSDWSATLPSGLSAAKKKERLFMIAATWADQIKQDGHIADGLDGGNAPPADGTGGDNLGYSDTKMRKYWHYIDMPFSTDGTATEAPPAINALTQIDALRAVLASTTASDDLKSYDLVWLLHLIGDVHQPLHATSRFTATDIHGDSGGNEVTICDPDCSQAKNKKSLHAFWDGLFGTTQDLKAGVTQATTAFNGLSAAPASAASDLKTSDWIDESFSLAKSDVYKTPVKTGNGPYVITGTYRTNAKKVAKKRIALAGARLAKMLNTELH
jgi:hypothetical protein